MKEWADSIDRVIESIKQGDWADALDSLHALRTALESVAQDSYSFGKDLVEKSIMETVSGIVDEVARQWRAGEFNGDREAVMQSIEESCDAACTYTQRAQYILAVSRHDDAYLEEYGELPEAANGSMPWGALAVAALRQDVIKQLGREPGVELDQDPPDVPLVDCGSCGDWKPGKDGVCDDCRDDDADEDDEDEEGDA